MKYGCCFTDLSGPAPPDKKLHLALVSVASKVPRDASAIQKIKADGNKKYHQIILYCKLLIVRKLKKLNLKQAIKMK